MNKDNPSIHCALKAYRQRKGLSQEELAASVGIRRQAIYDMESGKYLPNTGVALQLARVLDCTVEMLFGVDGYDSAKSVFLPPEYSFQAGRLALAKIKNRLVGVPLQGEQAMNFQLTVADGVLGVNNKIDLLLPEQQLEKNILLLGCDPALSILGSAVSRMAPAVHTHVIFASSGQALSALGKGNAHIAGTHFHSEGQIQANLEAIRKTIPDLACLVIAFSIQEEGLMVAHANPLNIRGVEDLPNNHTRFLNRENGAALRKLFDSLLAKSRIPNTALNGYDDEVLSHCAGAFRVANGMADAALGLRIVADAFGLDFVPLATTQCDLVIPQELCSHSGVLVMLDALQSGKVKNALGAISGYDASVLGTIVQQPK